jgi:hypothetical protein
MNQDSTDQTGRRSWEVRRRRWSQVYAFRGQSDEAISWLERALADQTRTPVRAFAVAWIVVGELRAAIAQVIKTEMVELISTR